MKFRASVISAGLIAALMSPIAYADQQKQNLKFCHALEQFNLDLSKLEDIGPTSTVAELRTAANKVSADANKVQKEAAKIKSPTARQFSQSAMQLRSEVRSLEGNMTVEQAKSRIEGDVDNVKSSAAQLADESGCPAAMPTQHKGMQPKSESGGMNEEQPNKE